MAVVDGERSCYVASFKDDVTEDLIEELFTQVGPVSRVLMKTLPKNDQRYALVEFEDEESVIFAIETLDGIKLFNQSLTVKPRNGTNQEEIWKRARGEIDKRQRSNPVPQPNTSSHRTSHQRAAPQPYAIPDRSRNRSQYQQYSTPQSSYQNSSQHYHSNRQHSAPANYHQQHQNYHHGGNGGGHSNSYHQQEYTPRRPQQNQQSYNNSSGGGGRGYEDRRQSGGGPDRNYSTQRYSTPRNQGNWR